MGTGYTRNDTSNNIADGNVINAADFDGEYDAIEAAFNSSSGHTHDGTASEGAPVTVLGPNQEFVASSSSVNPSTNAALDLGTASLKFKDLYIDGTAYIDGFAADILTATDKKVQFRDAAIFINSSTDGQLDIDADTTIELNSPEVIATDDFRLKSDAAILTFGADNDVTVTHVADTGLDAQAASGFVLKLQTGDTTVESGNTLGKISFNAPSEASGSDAILVGAEIEAAAEDTFSSTVNSTALVFKTNTGAAATERVRIKSDGDVVFTGASANMTWDTSADSLDFQDGGQISLGSDDDLVITHSGSAGSITNATGDLTLDVEGDIVLDANGADVIFKDNGTAIGKITNNSNNLEIHSSVSDADIVFIGNDGGTPVTALTLDMSEGGKAIFATGAETAFSGATTITTADNTAQLTLISTDADASIGPLFVMNRNSSSPADDDQLGKIQFLGEDDADNSVIYSQIVNQIKDQTDGTEDGRMSFNIISAGADKSFLNMTHDGTQAEVVVNEESIDMDFRVESNDKTHMLFVDAANNRIGINNNAPDTSFQITETTAPAILRLHRTGATNAADAVLGQLEFFNQDGTNDGPNVVAKITGSTHTSGGAGGNLRFFTHDATETGGEGSDPVERARISGVGYLGIGTTDPDRILQITGDRSAILRFENTRTVESENQILGSLEFYSNDESGTGANVRSRINAFTSSGGNSSYLTFSTADGTTDDVEHMRINPDGKIGIGLAASIGAALHVDPATNVTTALGAPLIKVGGANSWAGAGSLYSIGLGYVNADTNKSPTEIGVETTSGAGFTKGDLVFATRDVTTDTTPTERMRIDSAGHVGIGTDAPSPTKLAILAGGSSQGVLLGRNASGNPTSGQDFGSFGFKGIMDGVNTLNASEARITARASENHSGTTAGTHLDFYSKNTGTGPGSGPTLRMRVEADGDVNILDGNLILSTNGHGINFAGPTALAGGTSQILDKYEEGTFTPTLSIGGVTLASTSGNGRYTIIGRKVYIEGTVTRNTASGGSGTIIIHGLPYTASAADSIGVLGAGTFWMDQGNASTDTVAHAYVAGGNTYVQGVRATSTGARASDRYANASELTNGRPIYFNFSYVVA